MLQNMVTGVSEGYSKSLEILGVGYKFDIKSPIIVKSHDKQLLGYFAAYIRSLKKPEPYKGKGIRYVGEHVRRKAGKTAGK